MPRVKRAPKQLVPSEHESQKAFFLRVSLDPRTRDLPIFAIANGGHRHIAVARKLKAEGVKAGVPDIFVAVPSVEWQQSGLFIEMKRKGNRPTELQDDWHQLLRDRHYAVAVCYSADEAWRTLMQYLGFND